MYHSISLFSKEIEKFRTMFKLSLLTYVIVPITFEERNFGGRPVIKLDLDNTENINKQTTHLLEMFFLP